MGNDILNTVGSRRAMLTGLAGSVAFAVPTAGIATVASWRKAVSPEIAAAIDRSKTATAASLAAYDAWDNAESAARKKFGNPSSGLIHWRNYHVGEGELERVRDEVLALGFDREQVEQEYIDAKERLRDSLERLAAWERKVGIADLAKQRWDALAEHWSAAGSIAEIKPTSVADALALQGFVWTNLIELESESLEDWEFDVLKNTHAYFQSLEQ
jgi:hypothetical protein